MNCVVASYINTFLFFSPRVAFKLMATRRLYIIEIIIVMAGTISLIEYLQRHHFSDFLQAIQPPSDCEIETCKNYCTLSIPQPYIALGPSKVEEVVPMSVLQKNVPLDSFRGLRYLDQTSLSRFYQCKPKNYYNVSIKWCSERTFQVRNSPLVALVSFHGSGNTWLRYLIEQASGVFSGSLYCDTTLKSEFPGEFVVSGNVVVIKSHHADTRALPKDVQLSTGRKGYDKAIILVRNPFDALISEANRRWNSKHFVNSHVGLAGETSFISKFSW